jgi:hypothetical protein
MRHALADTIIHRDKRSFGIEAGFDCARQQLRGFEIWFDQRWRELAECFNVFARNEQRVSGK